MSKYMAFVEDEIRDLREKREMLPKLKHLLENPDDGVLHATIDYMLQAPEKHVRLKNIQDLTNTLQWFDNAPVWEYFLDTLRKLIEKTPPEERHTHTHDCLAYTHFPIYHADMLLQWMHNHRIALSDVATNIGRELFSIHAMLLEDPKQTASWIQSIKHHIVIEHRLLQEPLYHHDNARLQEVLQELAPMFAEKCLRISMNRLIDNKLPLYTMIAVHLTVTKIEDPNVRSQYHIQSDDDWNKLIALHRIIHNQPISTVGDQGTIKDFAYWLHPECVPVPKKPNQYLRDLTNIEQTLIEPDIPSKEWLFRRAYFQQNPQEMGIFLNVFDQASAHPALKHSVFSAVQEKTQEPSVDELFRTSISTDPQWNKVLLQSIHEGSIDTAAQWFCATYMQGISWSAVQAQARIIQSLDLQKGNQNIWRMAIEQQRYTKNHQEVETWLEEDNPTTGDPI